MRRITATTVALAFAALPLMAGAADKPDFSEVDKNDDGAVSVEEAKQNGVPEKEAKANDLDDDGELTKADWKFIDMDRESQG